MNDTLKVDLFQFPTVKISEEPVCKFLACLEQHALVRQLSASTAFWVCAYANNQHHVSDDVGPNPRSSSFYKAIQMSQGVLLVLDSAATPFKRIWCCFEESIVPWGERFNGHAESHRARMSMFNGHVIHGHETSFCELL